MVNVHKDQEADKGAEKGGFCSPCIFRPPAVDGFGISDYSERRNKIIGAFWVQEHVGKAQCGTVCLLLSKHSKHKEAVWMPSLASGVFDCQQFHIPSKHPTDGILSCMESSECRTELLDGNLFSCRSFVPFACFHQTEMYPPLQSLSDLWHEQSFIWGEGITRIGPLLQPFPRSFPCSDMPSIRPCLLCSFFNQNCSSCLFSPLSSGHITSTSVWCCKGKSVIIYAPRRWPRCIL